MRHLPETHAQPFVPPSAYVPPSQASCLSRPAEWTGTDTVSRFENVVAGS